MRRRAFASNLLNTNACARMDKSRRQGSGAESENRSLCRFKVSASSERFTEVRSPLKFPATLYCRKISHF